MFISLNRRKFPGNQKKKKSAEKADGQPQKVETRMTQFKMKKELRPSQKAGEKENQKT